MTAASWKAALAFVWRPENDGQGDHVDPGDTGGETNYGVTAATWAAAVEHGLVFGGLHEARTEDLAAVLRALFWNVVQGDALPVGVDLAVFNLAMVAGPGRAVRVLQQAIGVVVDGGMGPVTLHGAWARPAAGLIGALTDREESFFAACPTAWRFLKGWDRRAQDCRSFALVLVGWPPAATPATS